MVSRNPLTEFGAEHEIDSQFAVADSARSWAGLTAAAGMSAASAARQATVPTAVQGWHHHGAQGLR
jgi:hypothetical protein